MLLIYVYNLKILVSPCTPTIHRYLWSIYCEPGFMQSAEDMASALGALFLVIELSCHLIYMQAYFNIASAVF